MAKRQIMRIDVTGATLKKLPGLRERDGMTSLAMMSKLVGWYAVQDKDIQNAIVHESGDTNTPKVAKLIASRLAKG